MLDFLQGPLYSMVKFDFVIQDTDFRKHSFGYVIPLEAHTKLYGGTSHFVFRHVSFLSRIK